MPRTARALTGGICCHVIHRGNGRMTVFHNDGDYVTFVKLMDLADAHVPMRVLGWCLMPNHVHLVVWPREDGDLARWMQWLMTSHVRRHHRRHESSGHIWQGRYKSFPIQRRSPSATQRESGVVETEDPLLTVLRYVERNPVRAGLAMRAQDWPWSSLTWRLDPGKAPAYWWPGEVRWPQDWLAQLNHAQGEDELSAVRHSVRRGAPFGAAPWVDQIVRKLGLESTLRPLGRPRKDPEK